MIAARTASAPSHYRSGDEADIRGSRHLAAYARADRPGNYAFRRFHARLMAEYGAYQASQQFLRRRIESSTVSIIFAI